MIDLENIIGFIIFLVVAGSSIVSKILEQRKADAERQQRRKVDPSELPEATRRMLYGETGEPPREGQAPGHDIPTARRKGAGAPPMPRRSAQQASPPMPQRQEPPARLPELSPQGLPPAEPGSDEERRVRELRRRLQQQAEAQRKQAEFARQKAERERLLKQQQRQQAAMRAERRPSSQVATIQEEPEGSKVRESAKPEQPQRPTVAARCMTPRDVRRLVDNPASLRQGIVLMEILRPPVSLR